MNERIECPLCGHLTDALYVGKDYDYNDADGGYSYDLFECSVCGDTFAANPIFLGYADEEE